MLIRILQVIIILITIVAINSVLATIKADIYKKEGKESLKKNFPYLSVDKFNKALELDSSDGEAMGYLGTAYTSLAEKTNNIAQKRELLKKAIYEMKEGNKTYETPSFSYNLAKTYELSGDIDIAIKESVKSYSQIPSGETMDKLIFLYKEKGDMLLAQNKKDEAIKFYTKFVELKGTNVTNEDIVSYEFLKSLVPNNFFVRYGLAKLYMSQNLWGKVLIELEYLKRIGISNEDLIERLVSVYYNLGNKYYEEKKIKEAEEYLNHVLNLDSLNRFGYTFNAIYKLSSIYEQIGNIDKAVEILMKLEEFDIQKGQGYYQIAQLYVRKSDIQRAIEYYEKYLPFRPISDINIFITLGNLYEQVGNIDKAVKIYSKLEDINNYRGLGHYYIGLLYEKKERLVDAVKEFEYVLDIRANNSQILLKLGQVYEKMGDNKKALEIYKKVIAIDPTKTAELAIPMAKLYEKIGERGMALSRIKKNNMM